jgi:two-component system aerobic respiration control sensor histidine kinase ArcB
MIIQLCTTLMRLGVMLGWNLMDKKYILLVEDDAIATMAEKEILEHLDCKVDHAKDSKEAISYIKKNTYDLILMDLGLPDIDGINTSCMIREHETKVRHGCHVPIIAVTGNADVEQREKCLDAGMSDVVYKPLTLDKAQSILSNYDKKQ